MEPTRRSARLMPGVRVRPLTAQEIVLSENHTWKRYEDSAAGVRGWHLLGSEACEAKGSSCEPYAADCSDPVTDADARNLCWKRREAGGVEIADTPQTHNRMVR